MADDKKEAPQPAKKMADRAPLLRGPDTASSSDSMQTTPVSYSAADGDNVDLGPVGVASKTDHNPRLVYMLTFMACIGGFLFGYDTGVVSGAMIFIKKQFHLDSVWHELIVSITIGAAALFALIGGLCNMKLGRKKTILIASFMFTLGAVILAGATSKEWLLIGRFVLGAGVGIASSTIPVYIAETAPAKTRGKLVTSYNLAITFGQFAASVVDGLFSWNPLNGWRYMMGLAGVPALIQLIGFCFMPESPRWLIQNERHEEARAVLSKLVRPEDVENELEAIQFSVLDTQKERAKLGGDGSVFISMLTDRAVRKALVLGCGLQLFQQLGGINTVMYYSASIIQMSGVANDEMAVWLAALVAFVNFIFTFVGIALVDKIGRRPLTLGSQIGVAASLSFLAIGFMVAAAQSPPVTVHESLKNLSECSLYSACDPCVTDRSCGFCYTPVNNLPVNGSCLPINPEHDDLALEGRCAQDQDDLKYLHGYCPTNYGFMAVLGLGLYLAMFAPGMGPMPWTINSEIYPLWARSAGASAATAVNWLSNLLVSMTFLTLTETISKAGTFWLYAGISVIGAVFMCGMLPETRGKALEEIQILFHRPWCAESPCTRSKEEAEFEQLGD